jgi:hypothetical protein
MRNLVLTLLFTAIGAGALYAAWRVHESQEAQRGASAKGTVVEVREKVDARQRTTYVPVVRFRTGEGRDVQIVGSVGSGRKSWSVGEEIGVRYDHARPEDAVVDSFAERWFAVGGLTLLGLVFLYVGLWPSKKNEARPDVAAPRDFTKPS